MKQDLFFIKIFILVYWYNWLILYWGNKWPEKYDSYMKIWCIDLIGIFSLELCDQALSRVHSQESRWIKGAAHPFLINDWIGQQKQYKLLGLIPKQDYSLGTFEYWYIIVPHPFAAIKYPLGAFCTWDTSRLLGDGTIRPRFP